MTLWDWYSSKGLFVRLVSGLADLSIFI